MGFSIRKKTKGKSSWLNLSASKTRGLHSSYSLKLGKNTTLNFSKHGNRVTHNFGNGVRWTSYSKKEKKSISTSKSKNTQLHSSTYRYTSPRIKNDNTKENDELNMSEKTKWFLIFVMVIVITLIQLYIKGS